jgi:hypothetical protein
VKGTLSVVTVIVTVNAALIDLATTSHLVLVTAADRLILTETLTTVRIVILVGTLLGAAVAVTPVIIHVKEKKNLKCVRLKLVTFTAVKFQKLLSLDSLSESKTKSVLR